MLIHLLIQQGALVQTFEASRAGPQPVLLPNPMGAQLRLSLDGVAQSGRGLTGLRRGADLVLKRDGEELLVLQAYFKQPSVFEGDGWGPVGDWALGAPSLSTEAVSATDVVSVAAGPSVAKTTTSTTTSATTSASAPPHPLSAQPFNPATSVWTWPALSGLGLLVAAAGGGGGAGAAASVAAPALGLLTLSGQVMAGAFTDGVQVQAYNDQGQLLGSASMGPDGGYQLVLRTNHRGVVLLIARDTNGGSPNYTSELGEAASLGGAGSDAGHLRALVTVLGGSTAQAVANITPVTEMAVQQWQRLMVDDDAPAVLADMPTATELQELHTALANLLGLQAPEGAGASALPSWPVELFDAAALQALWAASQSDAGEADPEDPDADTTELSGAQVHGWVLAQLAGLDAALGSRPAQTVGTWLDSLQDASSSTGLADALPAQAQQQLNQGAMNLWVFWAQNDDTTSAAREAAQGLLHNALQAYARSEAGAAAPTLAAYAAAGMAVGGWLDIDAALINAALRGHAGDAMAAVRARAVASACELISSYTGDASAAPTASHHRLAIWPDSTGSVGPTVAAEHLALLNAAVAFANTAGALATPPERVDSAEELNQCLLAVQAVLREAGDVAGNNPNPTSENYATLGVNLSAFSANPEEGLLRLNALLRTRSLTQADTPAELQALVSQVGASALQTVAAFIGSASTGSAASPTPALADHQLAGLAQQTVGGQSLTLVGSAELALVNAALSLAVPATSAADVAARVRAAAAHAQAVLQEAGDSAGTHADPTADNYAAMGIDLSALSANPEEGLLRLNTLLRNSSANAADTPAELQALVAQVVAGAQQILTAHVASSSQAPGTVAVPTLADHQLAGLTEPGGGGSAAPVPDAANLTLVNAALALSPAATSWSDVRARVAQAVLHAQALLSEIGDSAGNHADPTANNYAALGIDLSALSANPEEGLLRLNALLRNGSASAADTPAELQALVAQVVQQASSRIDGYIGDNAAPTLADYQLAGATSFADDRLAWVNHAVALINNRDSNSALWPVIGAIVAAVNRVVGEVGDAAGTNPNPSFIDYQWFGLSDILGVNNQNAAAEVVSDVLRQRPVGTDWGPEALSAVFADLQATALATLSAYQSDAAFPTGFPGRASYDMAGVQLPAYADFPGFLRSWNSTMEAQIGSALARLSAEATDTLPEVQTVLDAYCRVLDYLSGMAEQAPRAADYLAIGINPLGPMAPMLTFADALAAFHLHAIHRPGRLSQLEGLALQVSTAAQQRLADYREGSETPTLLDYRLAGALALTDDLPRLDDAVTLLTAALAERNGAASGPLQTSAEWAAMASSAVALLGELGDRAGAHADPTPVDYTNLGVDLGVWQEHMVPFLNQRLRGLSVASPPTSVADLQDLVTLSQDAARVDGYYRLCTPSSTSDVHTAFTDEQLVNLTGLSAALFTDQTRHLWLSWAQGVTPGFRRSAQPDWQDIQEWSNFVQACDDSLQAIFLEIGDRTNAYDHPIDWMSLIATSEGGILWIDAYLLHLFYGDEFLTQAVRVLNGQTLDFWADQGVDTLADVMYAMGRLLVDGVGSNYFNVGFWVGSGSPGSHGFPDRVDSEQIAGMTLSDSDMALLLGMDLPTADTADGQQTLAQLRAQSQWLEVAMAEWRVAENAPVGLTDWTTVGLNALWGSAAIVAEIGDSAGAHADPVTQELVALGLDLSAWGADTAPELGHWLESLRTWDAPELPTWSALQALVAQSAVAINPAEWLAATQPPHSVLGA